MSKFYHAFEGSMTLGEYCLNLRIFDLLMIFESLAEVPCRKVAGFLWCWIASGCPACQLCPACYLCCCWEAKYVVRPFLHQFGIYPDVPSFVLVNYCIPYFIALLYLFSPLINLENFVFEPSQISLSILSIYTYFPFYPKYEYDLF